MLSPYSIGTHHACYTMIQSLGALCFIFLANVLNFKRPFKALLLLGNLSYEIYIIHFVVLMSLAPWVGNPAIFIVLSLTTTLLLACWTNKLGKKIILSR